MTGETSLRHVFVTPTFRRAAKRASKQNPALADQIRATVELLAANMHALSLRSHKLRGQLQGCWACSVSYGVRIIFEVGNPETIDGFLAETILLLTVGSHDEVY